MTLPPIVCLSFRKSWPGPCNFHNWLPFAKWLPWWCSSSTSPSTESCLWQCDFLEFAQPHICVPGSTRGWDRLEGTSPMKGRKREWWKTGWTFQLSGSLSLNATLFISFTTRKRPTNLGDNFFILCLSFKFLAFSITQPSVLTLGPSALFTLANFFNVNTDLFRLSNRTCWVALSFERRSVASLWGVGVLGFTTLGL